VLVVVVVWVWVWVQRLGNDNHVGPSTVARIRMLVFTNDKCRELIASEKKGETLQQRVKISIRSCFSLDS
jgi:hypothetical protein